MPCVPLITTQFTPARLSTRTVVREQLLEKLRHWRHSRRVLVAGSAGFGKTTLIAQWRQSLITAGAQVAWLSLAACDGRLETFFANVFGALRHAGLAIDDELLQPLHTADATVQAASARLINALAQLGGKLYLMVDDAHHITDARTVALLQMLCENLPEDMHLVLASRAASALQLGRLRALGQVCEIECAQLAFDFRESLAFLRGHLDEQLELETVHAAHALTAGWPIGLQLLAIALKNNPRTPLQSAAFAHNNAALADYLAQDVVAGLPVELLVFLQKLSVLRRFNAEAAAYIFEDPDAAQKIAALEEHNLFIQPLVDEGQRWYRMHPLFGEFLAQRLRASGVDERLLHGRAAHWFERAGLVQEAFRHGLQCEDFALIVGLLERVQPSTRRVSHLSQFMRWLEQLPQGVLSTHPNLLLLGIWGAVLTVLTRQAHDWIGLLESVPLTEDWQGQLTLLKAALAMHQDDDARCMALLESLEGRALSAPFQEQVRIALTISCLALHGHHGQARNLYRQPAARCLRSDDEMALMGQVTMASASLLEGKVLEAERLCAPVLDQAERLHGRRSVSACSAAVVMAEACYELNRAEQASEILANRLDILRFSAPMFMIGAALCHGRLINLQTSPRAALDYLAEKEEHFASLGLDRGMGSMLAEQLRLALMCDDCSHAEVLQGRLDELARNHRGATPCDAEIMTLAALSRARLSLARQQHEAALQALDIAQRYAGEFNRGRWRVQVDLLRAFALQALKREGEAQDSFKAAVACGYRLGLVRTLLDEGSVFQSMLGELKLEEGSVLAEYRQELFRTTPTVAAPVAAPVPREPGPAMTRREQEILDLLEQSMSNKHIALALNLSLQTVKWNLKNIFAKLGVFSRYDAILAMRRQRQ
ncbi:LuxR C-terminal-related transcriptional regulator [Pseudomonas alkylphenolica]|uniref:LuxR C-terminal-related transcriptional regulator n=1 Tax=Pseudomonas alkylphenolica TaxID=237609 RepID=UPI0018D82311|nr:LuxR C-terminal-related transcriptional regulator [Pseudomonas alkylphenolica]MBH3428935.1 AAA family ATPase [Pseudomonas alkylphenolica]